ncbi:integral membrane protein [Kwoniella heveanensis BCC8398]|uniref:Integral membrane protein n=1 Tax=Kwoniella heveanensis BCC8398 TaxID=1296120 RepID=A0A1B9H1X8_9TREE|nr:integral membrane protein [Kwoniella heveanensis BCC8398]
MSSMPVSTLVAGMFITGCANSLLSKYQDMECVENCGPAAPGPRLDFEQPVWQTLNMFAGEFLCIIPLLWAYHNKVKAANTKNKSRSQAPQASIADEEEGAAADEAVLDDARALTGWRACWMWFPAFFDICGTTLMNVGLILTPVSIYQMSRGALVLWVGVLSVIFLRRHLWLYQWAALVIVTMGVCLVGLSGSLVKKSLVEDPVGLFMTVAQRPDDDPARVALGVMLILFAQVFTASQYVVEEKIMSRYHVEPLAAVTLEGFFGLTTTLIAMPFLHIFLRNRSPYFDIPRGWHQIIGTPTVFGTCFAIMFSIGAFNFFGLSVTHRVSATTRSTVDTCRTLGIWVVSLGLGWEKLVWPFTLLQVGGFAMLVYGTFVFNGLISPVIFPPPPSIHLPHEPELEETGEVPAAAAQGRAGYDVVPERDV